MQLIKILRTYEQPDIRMTGWLHNACNQLMWAYKDNKSTGSQVKTDKYSHSITLLPVQFPSCKSRAPLVLVRCYSMTGYTAVSGPVSKIKFQIQLKIMNRAWVCIISFGTSNFLMFGKFWKHFEQYMFFSDMPHLFTFWPLDKVTFNKGSFLPMQSSMYWLTLSVSSPLYNSCWHRRQSINSSESVDSRSNSAMDVSVNIIH